LVGSTDGLLGSTEDRISSLEGFVLPAEGWIVTLDCSVGSTEGLSSTTHRGYGRFPSRPRTL
jgi:hypothetical protein